MNIPTKRWRGCHRALKRGEPWAIEFFKKSSLNQLLTWTYREEILKELIYNENPFLSCIKAGEKHPNLYYQPVILGLEHGVTFSSIDDNKGFLCRVAKKLMTALPNLNELLKTVTKRLKAWKDN